MITYHKIQTVFLRDPETNFKKLLEGQFAKPEFAYLANNQWEWTEKIDGTNIRVKFSNDGEGFPGAVEYAGKTDNANTHKDLLKHLAETFTVEKLAEVFPDTSACLYGEGYGAGIQKGGVYRQDKGFILFDVKIGDVWLERENVVDVAAKLGCPVVPIVGRGTLLEAVEFARTGYKSVIAEDSTYTAEGLIMKPMAELFNRRGERVISKIKFKDF